MQEAIAGSGRLMDAVHLANIRPPFPELDAYGPYPRSLKSVGLLIGNADPSSW